MTLSNKFEAIPWGSKQRTDDTIVFVRLYDLGWLTLIVWYFYIMLIILFCDLTLKKLNVVVSSIPIYFSKTITKKQSSIDSKFAVTCQRFIRRAFVLRWSAYWWQCTVTFALLHKWVPVYFTTIFSFL